MGNDLCGLECVSQFEPPQAPTQHASSMKSPHLLGFWPCRQGCWPCAHPFAVNAEGVVDVKFHHRPRSFDDEPMNFDGQHMKFDLCASMDGP